MRFSSIKQANNILILSPIFFFLVIGKKKSGLPTGIKHDLCSATTPLDSPSTFCNYRNKSSSEKQNGSFLFVFPERKVEVLTDAMVPRSSGSR